MCNDVGSYTKVDKVQSENNKSEALNDTTSLKPFKSIDSSEDSDDEEDVREFEGRTVSAKGHEVSWMLIR